MAYLEGLNERPEKDADGVTLTQEFDETRRSEESQETKTDEVVLQPRKPKMTSRKQHKMTSRSRENSA